MAQAKLKVILLRATPDPDEIVALGARLCYAQADIEALRERVETKDQKKFVEGVMSRGHLSVTEHASFTFAVEGVSRALLAQLTRHRIASFSVQSQRYVSMNGFDFIIPPEISKLGADAEEEFACQMQTINTWYCGWIERLMQNGRKKTQANEDARFVLPNACATCLLVTMNARELNHFFELRCCTHAQWEIRQLAWAMLKECKKHAPKVFEKAGPGCVSGRCPEGKRSCGMRWKAEQERRKTNERSDKDRDASECDWWPENA